MATFTTVSIGGGHSGGDMAEVIADKNYYYDAEGKVTTDESKGERWLAREGAAVMDEHQEALKAFQGTDQVARQSDTALVEDADAKANADDAKAAAPSANKKAAPSKNKGAK